MSPDDLAPAGSLADRIIGAAAAEFSLSAAAIRSDAQSGRVVAARQLAIYLLRKHIPLLSIKEAAAIFGRDHTTAIHAIRRVMRETATFYLPICRAERALGLPASITPSKEIAS